MKISTLLTITLATTVISASFANAEETKAPACVPAPVTVPCSALNGTWVKINGSETLSINASSITNGIKLSGISTESDSTYVLELDGVSRPMEDDLNFTYRGVCINNMVSMSHYYKQTLNKKIQFSINKKGQLVVSTTPSELYLDSSNTEEIYNRAQN